MPFASFVSVASNCLPKDALDPSDDLVRGRVRGLIEVDDTRANVRLDVALEGRAAVGDRGEVAGAHEHCRQTNNR